MKGASEAEVKSTSEGSEGARSRWFWHVPKENGIKPDG